MKTTEYSQTQIMRRPLMAHAMFVATLILNAGALTHGAAPSLRMPFSSADGEQWAITTGYGGSGTHQNNDYYALDFNIPGAGDHGEPIMTVAAGKVTRAGWSAPLPGQQFSYGYRVYVDHGDGYVSIYAHLDVISVEIGDSVVQGQVIGLCGTSGAGPNNYHLHFAFQHNGEAYKPEPMSKQSGFSDGKRVVSDNTIRRPVGVMAGSYEPAIAASVIDKFFEYREELGWPVDDGGGIILHEWGFDPAQRRSWQWGGYYIQNFDNGDWGSCALVYNPAKDKTYTLHGGFWNVFRYGIGDGSGWGPTIAVGGRQLGFPESDEYVFGSEVRQLFTNGIMVWDGSDVHIYTRDGKKFLTTSDKGPILSLTTEPVSNSRVRLSFPPVATAASYQVWIEGALAGAVSAKSSKMSAMQTMAETQESVTLSGMSPGMAIGVQVRAVDAEDNEQSRSPMAIAQSLQDVLTIESVSSNLHVTADRPFALAVEAAGPTEMSFGWYCNGELRATTTVPEFYLETAEWNDAGTWTVVVQDESGESASTEIQVQVNGLDFRHWQKSRVFSEIGYFAPVERAETSSAMSNEDAWRAYALGSSNNPAVAISGVADKNTVLQVKRLYAPRDVVYSVHRTSDLRTGWNEIVPETTANYIGPSAENAYGIWEVSADTGSVSQAFFMAKAEAVGKRELILYDTFEDSSLEPTLWKWQGNRVEETNNVLNVLTTETDNGGQAWTESFPIGNDTIEVVRRAKVRYGNDYSMPKLSLRYLSSDGTFHRVCGVFYGNMVYDTTTLAPVEGLVLGLGDASPLFRADLEKTVQGPPVLWDTWFLEKLSFDNRTGLIRYSVNGTEIMNGYAPRIDPDTDVNVYIDAWGWGTGHKNLTDYIEVYRVPNRLDQ